MGKSTWTIIGLVLSFGTVGCSGFGIQQSSSLGGQVRQEQRLDDLWMHQEHDPTRGIDPHLYAEQELGDLWNPVEQTNERSTRVRTSRFYPEQGLGDLWD